MKPIARTLLSLGLLATALLCTGSTATASAPDHPIEIGVYAHDDGAGTISAQALRWWEGTVGRHVATAAMYVGWGPDEPLAFPTALVTAAILQHDRGCTHAIPMITVEPWLPLDAIARGDYDDQLVAFAQDAAAYSASYGDPVRIRFAHEMIQDNVPANGGEWYPWQDQPAAYVAAWQHVHTVMTNAGATELQWVWCPNNWPFEQSTVSAYYPGTEYVDWLGMDGYNWSNSDGAPGYPDWQWFDDIFYCIYHTFVDNTAFYGEKPIMIGEFASAEAGPYEEAGQTKPVWITNAFDRMSSADYDRIAAFYWFNQNKENDWRVDSTHAAAAALWESIAGPGWVSHPGLEYVDVPLVLR